MVGVSGYGRWHLLMAMEQALLGRLELVGATIINRHDQAGVCRRLERLGVPVFDDFEQMLAALQGRVDLLLLPTGIQWHAPMTIAGLQAGAHVLVEKPVAATLQEVDAIMAAQAAADRLVAVGFQDLYVPLTQDIKRRVLAGEVGRLQRIVVRGQWPRSSAYYMRNAWAGRLRVNNAWVLDSPVSNAFAHFLMLALFWAGAEPATAAGIATVEAELYRAGEIESFDTACVRARTSGGVEILFYGTHAGSEELPPEVRLLGTDGTITWIYERSCSILRAGHPLETLRVPDQLDSRLCVLDAVLDRLEGGPRFVVEPALGREHTRLLNALHDHFPIHPIAGDHIVRVEGAAGVFQRIRGLDATVADAAAGGLLFSQTGAPWAVASGGACSLENYGRFDGGLIRAAARPGAGIG